jgi:small subunit ribosomal protein S6
VADLETNYKRDEKVIRFLTVALDKYAYAYSERRRNKKDEPKEKTNA